MPDILRRPCIAVMAAAAITIFAAAPGGASDDENERRFQEAGNLDAYAGITNLQSARLEINLASAIHQENLQIIQGLERINKRLDKLQASIEKLERRSQPDNK